MHTNPQAHPQRFWRCR